jgi:ATP-dependent DNA helicase RecQ
MPPVARAERRVAGRSVEAVVAGSGPISVRAVFLSGAGGFLIEIGKEAAGRDRFDLYMCTGGDLLPTLRERFGIEAFRPGQEEVIRALVDGRPVLAVMPTGAGKSLCYQLPALLIDGLTLVVSPLISLMQDQLAKLAALGIPAARIDSTVPPEEQRRVLAALEEARADRPRVLFVAPERFRSARFVEMVQRVGVGLLAIDEAHCISEWGHDFRPDYARLGEAIASLQPRRLVALTATATPAVREDIVRALGIADPAVFVRGFDRPNLHFAVEHAGGDADKMRRLVRLLDERPGAALIYTATRKRAEAIAEGVRRETRLPALAYHAGLGDDERARAQDAFMAGRSSVIVATSAFGMGVDKADVRLVVHHELPRSLEAYYQEAGRAGRDGQPARCLLLFNHGDVRLQEFFVDATTPEVEVLEGVARAVARERRAVDADGLKYQFPSGGGKWSAMAIGAALRILARQGVVVEQGSGYLAAGEPRAIDRAAAERQRAAERERLKRMTSYAYAAGCRRQFLLDYFGDPDRRAPCASCDACLAGRDAAPLDDEAHLTVRKVLSCVARLDGWFGRKRIALVLEGSRAKEVTDVGLDRLATHGCLSGRWRGFAMELIGALEAAGLLAASAGDYPTLRITAEGREVMHDRARAAITWPRERAEGRRARTGGIADGASADPELLERLRLLRRRLADEADLPAYCVFHDKTLVEMARVRPADVAALRGVAGVGPAKLEKYGAAFLEVLRGA